MHRLGGSILSSSDKLASVNELIDAGVDFIHYDVMDGLFVPNTHLSLSELKALINSAKPHQKEVHLMVKNPAPWVKALINDVEAITVHLESLSPPSLLSLLTTYRGANKLGLAIRLETPLSALQPFILLINYVVMMSVKPGASAQFFNPQALARIKALREAYPQLNIIVDGGVNLTNMAAIFNAGANGVISGSALLAALKKPADLASFRALLND